MSGFNTLANMDSSKLLSFANRAIEEQSKKDQKEENKRTEVNVERKGLEIIIPEKMTFEEAITALQLKLQEEKTDVRVNETIECFPWDGAHALMHVLKNRYGWASPVPTQTMFGPNPPSMISLPISPTETTQIFWGQFNIPTIDGVLETQVGKKNGKVVFRLSGIVKKKHEQDIKEIGEAIREFLKTGSIYKSKAIRLVTTEKGEIDYSTPLSFLDLSRVREEELVLPKDVEEQISTSLFTPIEHTEACRKHSIPLKRGVLLEGPYGTGKTLTAYITAKKAQQNNWTFIYLDRVTGIKEAFDLAKQYTPAIVFAEDVDRVTNSERTVNLDDILNQIDGIEAKNTEIITILTTNHAQNINQAMMRPGRLDAVITILPPDAVAVKKLLSIYGRNLIDPNSDITGAAEELAGQIPAVIREAIERAKLFAIHRCKGKGMFRLTGADVQLAAKGMKQHLAYLQGNKTERSRSEVFADAFRSMVQDAVDDSEKIGDILHKVHE